MKCDGYIDTLIHSFCMVVIRANFLRFQTRVNMQGKTGRTELKDLNINQLAVQYIYVLQNSTKLLRKVEVSDHETLKIFACDILFANPNLGANIKPQFLHELLHLLCGSQSITPQPLLKKNFCATLQFLKNVLKSSL